MQSIKILMLFSLLIAFSSLIAQEKTEEKKPEYGWKKTMVGGLNLTQTSFDNWTQGGENTLAWQINLNFNFTQDMQKTNWANSGKLTYGQTKSGDLESRKSIDEIKLESVFTYKLGIYVNPFVAATGETQFAPGYNYKDEPKVKVAQFMDPGYFRQSFGVGYEPNKTIKTRLGASFKQTVTSDFPQPYADDPETDEIEKFKNEIGMESVTDVNWKITDNTLFTSKLEIFSAFKGFDATDVRWDNVFTTKISKYVNMNFNFNLFYDKDISKKRQIKQALALGLTYSFL